MKNEIRTVINQVFVLTKASLAARYRKTMAGFIWVNLDPLLTFGVQSTVFRYILKMQIKSFYLFLASGLLPWIFFMTTIRMCTPLFEAKKDFLKTYKINPIVILFSQLLDNLINFMFTTFIIMPPLLYFNDIPLVCILFVPLSLVILTFGLFPMAWILSLMQIFFRDTKFIVGFVANIAYWITPVFYPTRYIPEKFQWLLLLNPFYHYTNLFRSNFYNFDISIYLTNAIQVIILDIFFIMVALYLWRKCKNGFYLNL